MELEKAQDDVEDTASVRDAESVEFQGTRSRDKWCF
jgi:hypothetical protein